MAEIKLGNKVKDKVTEVEGIVDARIEYTNGCIQYCIKQKVNKDGEVPKDYWADEQNIQVVGKGVSIESKPTGGGIRSHSSIGMKE